MAPSRVNHALLKSLQGRVVSPAFKAFIFAYLYISVPRIFFNVIRLVKKRRYNEIPPSIVNTLKSACKPTKFPALAAKLMLQINTTEPLIYRIIGVFNSPINPRRRLFLSTLMAAFCSALIHFKKFQNPDSVHSRQISLDLTLLVATRAVDAIVASSLKKIGGDKYALIGDGALFIASSTLIMYSWFYQPSRLPTAYRNWITSAASMDDEFVTLLREVKAKTVKYGERGPGEHLLQEFCKRNNQPAEKGSLYLNKPLSCECVHAFVTPNCELHALWRFARGFTFSMKLYGSINLVMLLFNRRRSNLSKNLIRAIVNACRSSCFLGSFIALCWYGVCLGRTRLLPRLFPNVPLTRWDDTIAVTCGCILCGFSCFVDSPQRRKELALFVAPRAVGTLIPPESSERALWFERLSFALSMAVLVAFAKKDPSSVRGIFGKGLQSVFSLQSYA